MLVGRVISRDITIGLAASAAALSRISTQRVILTRGRLLEGRAMKIDAVLHSKDLGDVAAESARAERIGHDTVWVTEQGTDPFLQAHSAALSTSRVQVGTAITVAFARSPMTTATSAWQLAAESGGRFILGLGSQVKAHIERRYSMPWGKPVAQMRDYILALQAIWRSWRSGEPLNYTGTYYHHTLSAPFWQPQLHDHRIPIWLAAVGPKMVELAGELCDGLLLHPFSNQAYEETVLLPALRRGLSAAGRDLDSIEVSRSVFMVVGDNEGESAARRDQARRQLAFYASTPAYRPVLDAVGLGELQPDLADLVRRQRWDVMPELLDDDFLRHFAVVGTAEQMPELTRRHLPEFVGATAAYGGWPIDDGRLTTVLSAFHAQ
jgi:probable F420-dependent oxidoreductase